MKRLLLVAGDITALLLVTVVGFASHGEFSADFIARMAASLVPLCLGWFLLAPALGLFDSSRAQEPRDLWRPPFAMLFAGPLAAVLRGIVLGSPIIPSFAVVLTVTAAVALTLWRFVWIFLSRRLSTN